MGMIRRAYARAIQKHTLCSLLACLVWAAVFCHGHAVATAQEAAEQTWFTTPEEALQALVKASQDQDHAALSRLFGPDYDKLLSGDKAQDAEALETFAADLKASATLQKVDDAKFVLEIGDEAWPFPVPIVKGAQSWRFDTAAGIEDFLDRRIGENELSAIAVCRAYVLAQWEYYTEAASTTQDGLAVYAQMLISAPGKRDGLYWEAADNEQPSPLGILVAQARAEEAPAGDKKVEANVETDVDRGAPRHPRAPYHGYYFKILKAQGANAPGGRFSYVINGNMIAGYALLAYPAKWGSSGVMTFIVNQQGRVYQKNLGWETSQIAANITEYNPDLSWELAQADWAYSARGAGQ